MEHEQQRQLSFELLITHVAGNNVALESLEATFHQDLNDDGTIGLVAPRSSQGSTNLLQVGRGYDLENMSSGTGPELQRGGVAVTVAVEYPGWTLIGAEQVAGGGSDVALKNTSTGQYSVWSTNRDGNCRSSLITHVAGEGHRAGIRGEHLPPGPQPRRHLGLVGATIN